MSVCVCIKKIKKQDGNNTKMLQAILNQSWKQQLNSYLPSISKDGGTRGVIVIVVGNEHGDSSSNPGRD